MTRLRAQLKEDGRGPYRWCFVVRTSEGLALGNIYRQRCDELTGAEVAYVMQELDETHCVEEVS